MIVCSSCTIIIPFFSSHNHIIEQLMRKFGLRPPPHVESIQIKYRKRSVKFRTPFIFWAAVLDEGCMTMFCFFQKKAALLCLSFKPDNFCYFKRGPASIGCWCMWFQFNDLQHWYTMIWHYTAAHGSIQGFISHIMIVDDQRAAIKSHYAWGQGPSDAQRIDLHGRHCRGR